MVLLPPLFTTLLRKDEKLNQLWRGQGKPSGTDSSGSGYDYSLARRLLVLGYRDVDDIATVLALRSGGSFQNGKDERYLRMTIGKALMS